MKKNDLGESWGFPIAAVEQLGKRLHEFWERYRSCFKTKTSDTSQYGYHYISGLLRMKTERNYTKIANAQGITPQNMQHFMSNLPWSYALCNAPEDTSKKKLAWWKCQRYFIERANQDSKSELGWDEFQAQKYQSFNHHLALVVSVLLK